MGHRAGVALMLVSHSGPDLSSRAALRLVMQHLPGVSAVEGMTSLEPSMTSEPPALRAATNVEGSALRAVRVPDYSREASSGFGGFLDGAQKVQVFGHFEGMPIVLGTVSAAVRVRVNRRMTTWGHRQPIVERKIYLPLRYLPPMVEIAGIADGKDDTGWQIVDTSTADADGNFPSRHPSHLAERAIRAVDRDREKLEDRLAEAWCARSEAPLFIDGGISRSTDVASSSCAIGVIKSHRTLYVEEDALRIVLGLRQGERSTVFRVAPRSRSSVLSWYLRLRAAEGRDALWGLVRVEVAECDRPGERADEVSKWLMAEKTPLSLPDGRWDKMVYGVRDCEEFLRAIS
ncbi:MAG: hypothetical protein ACREMS_07220 [Gemmatimonadaceae bacterium]